MKGGVVHGRAEAAETAVNRDWSHLAQLRVADEGADFLITQVSDLLVFADQFDDEGNLHRISLADRSSRPFSKIHLENIVARVMWSIFCWRLLRRRLLRLCFFPRYPTGNRFGFPPVSSASASEIGSAAGFFSKTDLGGIIFRRLPVLLALEDIDAGHILFSAIHCRISPHR